MNALLVEGLSKSFGEKVLFEGITFGLERGQKAALIARNGTGKSTLLDIIAGVASADAGQVGVRGGMRVGYLSQNPQADPAMEVLEAVLAADTEEAHLVREYELLTAVPEETWSPQQHARLGELTTRIGALGAWHLEARVKEVLGRLDIHNLAQPCGDLSGGQLRKVALAKVLVEQADLLILDEPTNHLDTATIEWLEELLGRSRLTLLLVTHDRYFLDQVCDTILELDNGRLLQYRGDYRYYLEKKAERQAADAATATKQKALYRKELDWIRRMPKARTTKSKARIQEFESLKERTQGQRKETEQRFFVKMERLGSKILEINNIHKRFGDINIVEDFSYTFKRGDKVGLVGPNGSGKSTFLDIVYGVLKPDSGRVVAGQTLKMAYFTQGGIPLDESRRVIDIVKDVAEEVYVDGKHSVSASRFLTMFGIAHAIQYNYAQHLSGGERRRLHLLMTLMEQPNFLLLDEPTNDLDIPTMQALEAFLEGYGGCLMVASHDRYFLDRIAGHLFLFSAGSGTVKDFYGNYTLYRQQREKERRPAARSRSAEAAPPQHPKERDPNRITWKEQRELEQLEQEIANLEKRREELEKLLQQGSAGHEALTRLSEEYGRTMEEIDVKSERWMILAEKE